MTTVIIVIHLMVVLAMIGLVMLQRSEGGALGISGGGGLLTRRRAGDVLTRSTGILAAVFFATSIGLALISRYEGRPADVLDRIPGAATAPATLPAGAPSPVSEQPTSGAGVLDALRRQSGGAPVPTPAPAAPAPAQTTTPATPAAPAPAAATPPTPAPAADAPEAPATDAPTGAAPFEPVPGLEGGASDTAPSPAPPAPAAAPSTPAPASGATPPAPAPAPTATPSPVPSP